MEAQVQQLYFPMKMHVLIYIRTSAIFMDIGKLGYNKPFEIYMRLAPRPLDAKIILEQILRTNQKSYFKVKYLCKARTPGSPARGTSMHSFWPTFDGFSPGISLSIKGVIPHQISCILKTTPSHSTCLILTPSRVPGFVPHPKWSELLSISPSPHELLNI